ncbi:phage tail protein [Peribacillus simplex]|uniref:Uncharacterized protein n=1 Tax=Peribacillus simplex TaxID=1478 RepID=A0A9W4KYL7_9BACI|nr:hypothetical protein [Peribacillus simplex]CAH0185842.1 hypothetical protein SRABI133_01541 [Peribacillus simplex]
MKEHLTAIVGARINDFQKKMAKVKQIAKKAPNEIMTKVGARITEFKKKMAEVKKTTKSIPDNVTVTTKGKINEFKKKMAQVKQAIQGIPNKFDVGVDTNTTNFRKKMAQVKKAAKSIPNKIVVKVEAKVNKFQNTIGRIANTMRAFDTVTQSTRQGLLTMVSPGIVPILASLAGVIGALGPMIGVMGGSTFAFAIALGFAGTAAVAFGAVAIPTISKLFEETGKLSAAQEKARGAFDKFKETWSGIVKDLEKPVLQVFTKAMQAANTMLKMARPLFDGAAKAANNLMTALNKSLDSAPIKAFFDYMNKQAGPMLATIGKAVGNFLQGFMSMMTAFGPLAEKTAQGFLNMSKGFATWAAGHSKSTKFQAFVNYINENMPKIRAIFRDALAGIVYFFSAFGPLSSDMMTSLQAMMGKFKEWASTLKDNQAFQDFIGYIRDNAPNVIALIGNLTNFLVNMGVALAPIGAKVLDVVNKFISWTNSMMVAHPMIGKIMAVLIVLSGALIALVPNIIAVAALFEGRMVLAFTNFIAKVVVSTATFVANAAIMIAKWALLGAQALLHAAKVSAAWFIALGPVGWVIGVIVALVALVIANWDTVKSATSTAWSAVSKTVNDAATKILGYIQEKFPALYKVIMSAMQSAQKIVTAVWDYIKSTFENTLSFLKALVKGDFQGMKDAISNQMEASKTLIATIWSAIKSYFGTVISEIVSTVKSKFSDLVSAVQSKMSEVKSKVQEAWNNVKSYLQGINLFSIGANIIKGLVSGIKSMAGSVVSAAKNVVGNAISAAKSLLKIHSPSRVFKGIGQYTGEGLVIGMNNMKSAVSKASSNMAKAAMIEPQRTQFAFDAGLSTSDFGRIRHDVGAEVSGFEMDPTINVYNEWDGEKVVSYVERGNAKKSRITDGFYGK